MFNAKPDRPYLESWLRRARKQLAGSGRLTELALILSREEGHSPAHWSRLIREILEEETTPSLDLLMRIDSLLAKPAQAPESPEQSSLF